MPHLRIQALFMSWHLIRLHERISKTIGHFFNGGRFQLWRREEQHLVMFADDEDVMLEHDIEDEALSGALAELCEL
jgi:hypothetical protein